MDTHGAVAAETARRDNYAGHKSAEQHGRTIQLREMTQEVCPARTRKNSGTMLRLNLETKSTT